MKRDPVKEAIRIAKQRRADGGRTVYLSEDPWGYFAKKGKQIAALPENLSQAWENYRTDPVVTAFREEPAAMFSGAAKDFGNWIFEHPFAATREAVDLGTDLYGGLGLMAAKGIVSPSSANAGEDETARQIQYGMRQEDGTPVQDYAKGGRTGYADGSRVFGAFAKTAEDIAKKYAQNKRIPQLQESAQRIKAGEGSAAEHADLVNQFKPVRAYDAPIAPATPDEMAAAFAKTDSRKIPKIGLPSQVLKEGDPAAVRLDIPSYQAANTWTVSVHEPKSDYSAGPVIGYDSVAHLANPTFGVQPTGAMNIASGKPKSTIATVQGGWKPTTPDDAYALAQNIHNDPAWAQVGMDPERHAYFYNRATMEPITSAEEALHIGPLVYAKNPVVGKVEDYPFARGGFARKHYATGGNPSYGDTVYEQLLKDIAAQKAKALPEVPELRRDTPQSITPGTKPAEVKHDLGGYEPVAEPVVRQPPTGAGGGGDGLSGSYGPGTSTPSGIMSSTSTAAAPPAGATPGVTGTPGFSFNGAPIGAVEAYDLPAPAPSAPLTTHAVSTTSVAPAPGQFGDMYTGQPATQNNAAANQAALGAQVGAQVGAALNTIGTTPAATPPAAASAPVGVSPSASQMAAAKSSLAAALQAQNAPLAMQPGVQQPSFVAPPAFTNPADLGPDVPSSMIGPAPGVDNVSNYSYGQLAAQNEAAQNTVGAVAAGLPSAPAAPAAPAAAAPAASVAPAAPMGMSISAASPATMAAMAAAARGASIASPEDEAQAEAEAQAQAEAAAANAAEADSAMAGTMDSSDNSDSMSGLGGDDGGSGYGDGDSGGGSYGDGDSGGGSYGDGDSGGGSYGGGDGGDGGDGGGGDGGGGGGGEKRGGLVKWKYHPVGRKSGGMVGKALAISDKRLYKMRDHKDWSEHKDFDKTGGKLSQMSPDEFLKKSKPLNMDHDDKHIIHHFKKKLEHGHKLDPVALYSGGGQDGRHRAHAAKQLGINKIPVITWPSKAQGGSIVDRALVVTSKKANRQPGRR